MGFGVLLMNGVIDAGEVVVGKAVARIVPQSLGIPTAGPMGLLTQAVTAIVVGWLGNAFVSSNAGKMMLAGALAAPVEDIIKTLNIPFLGPALGEDVVQIGTYPQESLGGYANGGDSMGEDENDYSQQAPYSQ